MTVIICLGIIHKGCPHKFGNFWEPLALSRPFHIWLTTLPLPLSVRTQGWHYLKHCNLWTIYTERYKNLIILILNVHTSVFVLDNFGNSIPKDGVDHEVNVTHRHDWPNKNTSVPKSLSRKRKDFIFQPLWYQMKILNTAMLLNFLSKFKYGSYNFFPSGRPHLANHHPFPSPHLSTFAWPPSPLMCGHPLWMAPLSNLREMNPFRVTFGQI